LLETVLQVITFLLLLLTFNGLGWRAFAIGLDVCVSDTDIQAAISPSSLETPDQEIPYFIFGAAS
jgi:hypothetical protein